MNRNIVGLIIFIIAVGVGFGAVFPKLRAVRDVSLINKAKLQIANNKVKRKESLVSLSKTFGEKKSDVDAYLSVLPKEPEIPEVLVSIEAMGKENAVNLTSIVPQVDSKGEVVNATLVGEGDLVNIEKLMQAIAQSRRPMSITSIVMSKKQTNQIISFTLTVQFPYLSNTSSSDAPIATKTSPNPTSAGSQIEKGIE